MASGNNTNIKKMNNSSDYQIHWNTVRNAFLVSPLLEANVPNYALKADSVIQRKVIGLYMRRTGKTENAKQIANAACLAATKLVLKTIGETVVFSVPVEKILAASEADPVRGHVILAETLAFEKCEFIVMDQTTIVAGEVFELVLIYEDKIA
jgi:hypothetical protein